MAQKKWRIHQFRYMLTAYFILLLTMFLLPILSVEEYSIVQNTTSHLGAQHSPYSWVMNIVFGILGIASIMESWLHLEKYWFQKILLTIFGLGFFLLAFFQHAPIVEGIAYNLREDEIHSILASTIGFSFTTFAISVGFIEGTKRKKLLAIMIGIIVTVFSVLMLYLEAYAGIWQRLIFILSFGWLVYFFEKKKVSG